MERLAWKNATRLSSVVEEGTKVKGETIRDVAQDIHCLMMQVYPGQCEGELGQHIARDAFLVALNDPALQIKVRERESREPWKQL